MLPPVLFIIPMFILYLHLGLLDTQVGLIIIYLTFNIPLSVWVLKSFLDDFPKDFEESAMVDGCSRFQAMLRIVFPLASPGVIAVAILCFFFSFNEFLFALVFTTLYARTMTVMASIFVTEYTYQWADLAASTILMAIPMMIFVAIIQRELVRGLTMGAIKG
jgi:multiple sugar transport system permease protein